MANNARHVAFYMPSLMGGGAEKVMSLLANGLAERGFRVDFVLVKAQGIYLNSLSTRVHVVDLQSSNEYTSLPKLIAYLRQHRPTVLFSSLNLTNLIALLATHLAATKTRSIIRIANTISSQKRVAWKKRLEKTLVSWIYPWADQIIAVSQTVSDDLAKYARIPTSRIRVIYNPVQTTSDSSGSTLHPWMEDRTTHVVLGIGRLTAQKDFKTLIEAFAILRQRLNIRLIVLGEGEVRQQLENLITKLNIQQDVDLPGYVTDTAYYLSRASVFVLSSAWEGLPNVLIEALNSRCPVVSTDCPGGIREILADGEYGELVPIADPMSMADAIGRALSGRGRQVSQEWLTRFSFDRIIDQVTSLIESGASDCK